MCRLYTKSIMIPRQFGAAGSAGDSPARLLQEEKHLDEDSDEQGGIILKDSGDDANKQADSRYGFVLQTIINKYSLLLALASSNFNGS